MLFLKCFLCTHANLIYIKELFFDDVNLPKSFGYVSVLY